MLEIIAICSVIAVISWKMKILSPYASFMALLMAVMIWSLNGLNWLALLISFMLFGFIATKWKYTEKSTVGLSEPNSGRRNLENVLGNGLSPTLFAVLAMPYAFAGSVSTVLADTFASEIGVLSEKARLITTFERTDAGTNGAISVLGTASAIMGSAIIALIASYLLNIYFLPAFIGGFLGCQVDSLLGATLERKMYLEKSSVNFLASLSGGLISYIFVMLV